MGVPAAQRRHRSGSVQEFCPTTPFAEFMLAVRLNRKLQRKTVAIDSRVSYPALLYYERGDMLPSVAIFARWARVVRLTETELRRALYLLAIDKGDAPAEPGPLLDLMEGKLAS